MAKDKPAITDIDVYPDGDVVLVCAPSETEQLKLRVSSMTLGMTSPVFKAMLSPRFREGNALAAAANSSVEIQLPEDDGSVMLRICGTLHMRYDLLETASAEDLTQLAVTCDKYGLCAAIAPSAYSWFERVYSNITDRGRIDLITAAATLRMEDMVSRLGRDIVRTLVGPLVPSKTGLRGMHRHLYRQIEVKRESVRAALFAIVETLVENTLSRVYRNVTATPSDALTARYLKALKEADLWPSTAVQACSVSEYSRRISTFRPEELPKAILDGSGYYQGLYYQASAQAAREPEIMSGLDRWAWSAELTAEGGIRGFRDEPRAKAAWE